MIQDLSVIVPVYKFNNTIEELLLDAVDSVVKQKEQPAYILFVGPNNDELGDFILDKVKKVLEPTEIKPLFIVNDGELDFCNQVNLAVNNCPTNWFSILEFDDLYTDIWFKNFNVYRHYHDNVGIFLPLANIITMEGRTLGMTNQQPWAKDFSGEIGYIDLESLMTYYDYNVTGSLINKEIFLELGGLKPSLKISFWYEFLLRMVYNGNKIFIIPKVGYVHTLDREDSLFRHYQEEIPQEVASKWIKLAQQEYFFKHDRNKDPLKDMATEVPEELQ